MAPWPLQRLLRIAQNAGAAKKIKSVDVTSSLLRPYPPSHPLQPPAHLTCDKDNMTAAELIAEHLNLSSTRAGHICGLGSVYWLSAEHNAQQAAWRASQEKAASSESVGDLSTLASERCTLMFVLLSL